MGLFDKIKKKVGWETEEEFESRQKLQLEQNRINAKLLDERIEKDWREKHPEERQYTEKEYEDYLRDSGVFKGMTPEEAFESVSKSRKEMYQQGNWQYFTECGNCGKRIFLEPKDYDRQIECPECKTVGTVGRFF